MFVLGNFYCCYQYLCPFHCLIGLVFQAFHDHFHHLLNCLHNFPFFPHIGSCCSQQMKINYILRYLKTQGFGAHHEANLDKPEITEENQFLEKLNHF